MTWQQPTAGPALPLCRLSSLCLFSSHSHCHGDSVCVGIPPSPCSCLPCQCTCHRVFVAPLPLRLFAGEEYCTFIKPESFYSDMLATREDSARLKSFLKVDWLKWPTEPAPPPSEDPFNAPAADIIVPVTSSAIPSLLAKHGVLFLDVSFPWCWLCHASRQMFVEVAGRVTRGEVNARLGDAPLPLFGKVDAREERDLSWRFNASCRAGLMGSGNAMPCGFVVVQKTGDVLVREKHTANDLLGALVGYIGMVSSLTLSPLLVLPHPTSSLCVRLLVALRAFVSVCVPVGVSHRRALPAVDL